MDSYISGAVDYIFGNATAVFDHVEIHSIGQGYVTAQSRLRPDETTGYVIRNSRITTEAVEAGKVSLGRPWRPFSRVVYLRTEMDAGVAGGSICGAAAMIRRPCSTRSTCRADRVEEPGDVRGL